MTFARVVRPLLLRLAGAASAAARAAAGARGLRLQEEGKGRREYVRVKLCARRRRRASKPSSTRRRARACITSLTETDGLVELSEQTIRIEPRDRVGFLSYAAIVG